jgi:hypothetical protein
MSIAKLETREEKIRDFIDSLDLSDIISKLVHQYNWQHKHAVIVVHMYKNFLFLNAKYGEKYKLTPSEEIDEIWHLHILETKKYRKDCYAIFGKYFDHNPMSFKGDIKANYTEMAQSFNKMLELYRKEFNNAELYQIRGLFAKLLSFFKGVLKRNIG